VDEGAETGNIFRHTFIGDSAPHFIRSVPSGLLIRRTGKISQQSLGGIRQFGAGPSEGRVGSKKNESEVDLQMRIILNMRL
jgi:hypothetical protein